MSLDKFWHSYLVCKKDTHIHTSQWCAGPKKRRYESVLKIPHNRSAPSNTVLFHAHNTGHTLIGPCLNTVQPMCPVYYCTWHIEGGETLPKGASRLAFHSGHSGNSMTRHRLNPSTFGGWMSSSVHNLDFIMIYLLLINTCNDLPINFTLSCVITSNNVSHALYKNSWSVLWTHGNADDPQVSVYCGSVCTVDQCDLRVLPGVRANQTRRWTWGSTGTVLTK